MNDKEREKKCFFIFILFDTSVTFYASMFCESGPSMHCRLCDSFFHLSLPTVVKMGSSNPPLLLVKRVGSRSGSTLSAVLGTIFLQIVSAGDAILYYILKVL